MIVACVEMRPDCADVVQFLNWQNPHAPYRATGVMTTSDAASAATYIVESAKYGAMGV